MSKSMLPRKAARTTISPRIRATARLTHTAIRLPAACRSLLEVVVDASDTIHLSQRLVELGKQAHAPGLPGPPHLGALGVGDVHKQARIEAGERLNPDDDVF